MKYIVLPIMSLFILSEDQAGTWTLFKATSARYPPATTSSSTEAGVALPIGVEAANGSDGKPGSGVYLVDWNAETAGNPTLLSDFRNRGVAEKIMQHTLDIFGKDRH